MIIMQNIPLCCEWKGECLLLTQAVCILTIIFYGVKVDCKELVSSDVHWIKLAAYLIQSIVYILITNFCALIII